jgi:hypothetical protein
MHHVRVAADDLKNRRCSARNLCCGEISTERCIPTGCRKQMNNKVIRSAGVCYLLLLRLFCFLNKVEIMFLLYRHYEERSDEVIRNYYFFYQHFISNRIFFFRFFHY